jgi:hypothetical protein
MCARLGFTHRTRIDDGKEVIGGCGGIRKVDLGLEIKDFLDELGRICPESTESTHPRGVTLVASPPLGTHPHAVVQTNRDL